MFIGMHARILVILVGLSYIQRLVAQTTITNPDTCAHSLVVPPADIVSTCQSISDNRVHEMQKLISELQNKVNELQGDKKTISRTIMPSYACGCNNNTVTETSFKGQSVIIVNKNQQNIL
jgi:hypothetical protein